MIKSLTNSVKWMVVACLWACFVSEAMPQTDSLYAVLAQKPSDSIRVQCYQELARYYLNHRKPDSTIIIANRGIELSGKAGLEPKVELYRLLINAHDARMEYRISRDLIPPLLEMLGNSDDPEDKVWLSIFEGSYYYRSGEFTKSIEAFEQARLLAGEKDMQDAMAQAYLGLGRVYYSLGDDELEGINYKRYLERVDMKKEKYSVYFVLTRLGDLQRETGNIKEGIETYYTLANLAKKADDTLRLANTLNRIAWGYYELGELEKSLEVYQENLEISKQVGSQELIANCLGNIGNIYRDWNYFEEAIEYYTLSLETSKEIGDMYNLSWLHKDISKMYANMGRYEMAYDHYVLHSAYNDTLMSEDYGRQLLQARNQYEQEKNEQELELMQLRLQRNNYLLYGFGGLTLLIIVIALLFIRAGRQRTRQRIEAMNHKVSDLTQKNLRAQMNPHFIFNTLNSRQYYVFENDRIASNNYMTKFAKLIRKTLENSEHPAIPIHEEVDALELYLELESLRFKKKFEWKIDIDDDIDTYMYKIPTMLIQPFVENSIGHGLMHKEGKGQISISMKLEDDFIRCTIEDNGVGRKKAMEIRNSRDENHRSLGTSITESRLKLVNSLYGKSMKVKYTDLKDAEGKPAGTRVVISIPIIT